MSYYGGNSYSPKGEEKGESLLSIALRVAFLLGATAFIVSFWGGGAWDPETKRKIQIGLVSGVVLLPIVLAIALLAYWKVRDLYKRLLNRYHEWQDNRIDAKMDLILQKEEETGASSSNGPEQLTLTQKVPGSSPGRPTGKEVFLRRRISWFLEEKLAVAMFPDENLPTKFQWRNLPRSQDPTIIPQAGIVRYRDFQPGEHTVQLCWDGIQCETFRDDIELRKFVIRFVYSIDAHFLIPSELLADAGLVYDTGDWVDEWCCADRNDEIVEAKGTILRPPGRNIQFSASASRQPHHIHRQASTKKSKPGTLLSKMQEIPAKVTSYSLAKEECYYVFKAGGFFEERKAVSAEEQAEKA